MNNTTLRELPLSAEFILKRERINASIHKSSTEMVLRIREQYEARGLDWSDLAAHLKISDKRAWKLWNCRTDWMVTECVFALPESWMSHDDRMNILFPDDDLSEETWTDAD